MLSSDISFKNEDILKAIVELKTNSAPGPDGVPTSLLLNCKVAQALSIYILWRHSMDTRTVPYKMKMATITPIHKKGEREV